MVQRINSQKLAKIIGALCVLTLFIGYGVFEARKIIQGPQIILDSPLNGSTITEPLVTLSGNTKNVKTLSINGRILYIDEKGAWQEQLMLPPGYNIIRLEGVDRFGNKTTEKIELVHNFTQS